MVWALSVGHLQLAIGVPRVLALDIATDMLCTGAGRRTPPWVPLGRFRIRCCGHRGRARQLATALTCRSETRWVGDIGLAGNRLLLGAIAADLLMLVALLTIPPLASQLGHEVPTTAGLAIAVLAIPAIVLVDAVDEWARRAVRSRQA